MPSASIQLSQTLNDADEDREKLLAIDIDEPMETKFRVRNLTKFLEEGEVAILKGINFEVPRCMNMGITRPRGSGKSTLLRAFNRLWEPPAGTVFMDGTVADNVQYGPELREESSVIVKYTDR
ncbi:ABC transporter-like, ATP-binding domain [Dillenia turbinata]|uniref:ABC transporter-like, ATP-binding domain n=1 Tax=Dillenia turbinata TaxID=194707 RepID=A0AAN8ZBX6_9MAGN